MALNEPKDTRQMQSLTAATGQPMPLDPQDLRNQTDRQPGAMPDLPSLPMATPGGTGGRGAAAGFRSKVLEERQARKAQQAAAAPAGPTAAEAPAPAGAQTTAAETDDVTPEAGLTAPPSPEPAPAGPQIGDMVTTGVQTTQVDMDPKLKNAVEKEITARGKAEEAKANLINTQHEMAKEQAKLVQANAAKQTAEAQALQERMEANRAAQQQAMDRYNQDYEKYASMSIQNPWSRTSTGSKIMAGLSIVLGGLSGPGGAAAASKTIQEALDKDIELQKATMDKKKGELTMIQQHARELRAQGMKDIDVTKSMQAMANGALAGQLEAMATQTQASDPAKASLLAENAVQARAKETELRKQVAENVKTTTTSSPLMPAQESRTPLDAKRLDKLEASEGNVKAYTRLKTMLKDPEFRSKVGKISGNWNRFKSAWLGDAKAAELMSETDRALLAALREATGAQMTDAERAFIAQTMPSFTENIESFESKLDARFKEAVDSYQQRRDRYGRNFDVGGFRPVDQITGEWYNSLGFQEAPAQ